MTIFLLFTKTDRKFCLSNGIQLSAGAMPKLIGITMVNIFIASFGPLVYNTDVFPCFAQYVSCCVASNNLQPDCPHPGVNTCPA